jgi:hypothetical protein
MPSNGHGDGMEGEGPAPDIMNENEGEDGGIERTDQNRDSVPNGVYTPFIKLLDADLEMDFHESYGFAGCNTYRDIHLWYFQDVPLHPGSPASFSNKRPSTSLGKHLAKTDPAPTPCFSPTSSNPGANSNPTQTI